MSTGSCQHCGDVHAPDTPFCPRTGDAMHDPGLVGSRVDRYSIERLLGQGGMGSVYRARHVVTDSRVAMKVLKPALVSETGVLDRFMREAKLAAAIPSDHIVRVLDAEVTQGGTAFIAMELLEGEDLQQIARREKKLHPARAASLIAQTLDGLSSAHQSNVVHRDMKPANVFVSRRRDSDGVEYEHAKVLDFGISKMQVGDGLKLTMAGITMGTPGYMAYEQFFDARDVDARTDLYSVAVMAYELLSGRKPYEGDTLATLVEKIRTSPPPPLRSVAPSLPVPLCAIVDKGLSRKRERRWQSAAEFANALRGLYRLLGDPPPLAPVAPPAPRQPDPQVLVLTHVKAKAVDPEALLDTRRPPSQPELDDTRIKAKPGDDTLRDVEPVKK